MLATPNTVIYQLRITLRGISPLIWRRLLVRAETSLAELHHILQLALGWTNSHVHRFITHGKEYGIAYEGGMGFADAPRRIRLADFISAYATGFCTSMTLRTSGNTTSAWSR